MIVCYVLCELYTWKNVYGKKKKRNTRVRKHNLGGSEKKMNGMVRVVEVY